MDEVRVCRYKTKQVASKNGTQIRHQEKFVIKTEQLEQVHTEPTMKMQDFG